VTGESPRRIHREVCFRGKEEAAALQFLSLNFSDFPIPVFDQIKKDLEDIPEEQRKEIKEVGKTLENRKALGFKEFKGTLLSHLKNLTSMIPNHFYKEENILFI
jgi:hypothetical protein